MNVSEFFVAAQFIMRFDSTKTNSILRQLESRLPSFNLQQVKERFLKKKQYKCASQEG
jgi:hypothetical protein